MIRAALSVLLVVILIAPSLGCQKKGPAEKAGEKLDEKVEQVTGETSDTFEEAGEKLDETVEEVKKEAEKAKKEMEKASDH